MPATVTLSSTTLQLVVGASDGQITVSSTTGLLPGVRLFVDQELMAVISLGPTATAGPLVNVRRGVDGTTGAPHNSLSTMWIGQPDQFYSNDPTGRPGPAVLVSPYINARNGNVWFAQGDATPGTQEVRYWQLQTPTYSVGPLGVNVTTLSPTSST